MSIQAIKTPNEHARGVINSMASRLFLTQPPGMSLPFDHFKRYCTALYHKLEREGRLKPIPIDPVERKRQADEKFNNLGQGMKLVEDRFLFEGEEARELDDTLQSAVDKAKRRTPLVTSLPGQAAKRSHLHKA
jgi:hypothetical protein